MSKSLNKNRDLHHYGTFAIHNTFNASRRFPSRPEDMEAEDYYRITSYPVTRMPEWLREDAHSFIIIALLRTLPLFNPKLSSLYTYLSNRARGAGTDYMRKELVDYRHYDQPEWFYLDEDGANYIADDHALPQDRAIDFWRAAQGQWDTIHSFKKDKRGCRRGIKTIRTTNRTLLLDNIPYRVFRRKGTKPPKKLEGIGSLASRRDNMPNPTYYGFPWSIE